MQTQLTSKNDVMWTSCRNISMIWAFCPIWNSIDVSIWCSLLSFLYIKLFSHIQLKPTHNSNWYPFIIKWYSESFNGCFLLRLITFLYTMVLAMPTSMFISTINYTQEASSCSMTCCIEKILTSTLVQVCFLVYDPFMDLNFSPS